MNKKSMKSLVLACGFARSEQKRLGFGALIVSLLIAFFFCTVFKTYFGPKPFLNMQISVDVGLRMPSITEPLGSQKLLKDNYAAGKKMKPICSMEPRTDFCDISGNIRIHGKSGSVFVVSTEEHSGISSENSSWIIRPYARKRDAPAMNRVREWTVKLVNAENQENIDNALPGCTKNHDVPAVLFSLGGYSGNIFHAFSDILIPLYSTSRKFNGEVRFLVTNKNTWWVKKYFELIRNLSNYDVIYIDDEKEEDIHCFENAIVGLKRNPEFNKELMLDPSTSLYSLSDFRQFIKNAYALSKPSAIRLKDGDTRSPKLLILSRKKTRAFENANEIAETARRVGFEIVVAEANASVSSFAQVVSTCDAMVGVHGAGLTNMVFLPENAVLIQILPVGGFEWMGKTYYADPPKRMNLRYLEYKIGLEESSLMQRYPLDHEVMRNQTAVKARGWRAWKSVYLDQQNVNLDVNRFKPVLLQALELLHQ